MTRRGVYLLLLVAALLIAGVVSGYASAHPDGLEYVAQTTGFFSSSEEHAGAGSPLADYAVAGVENGRLSGGLAGVAGTVITLLLAGGCAWLIRRRTPAAG